MALTNFKLLSKSRYYNYLFSLDIPKGNYIVGKLVFYYSETC